MTAERAYAVRMPLHGALVAAVIEGRKVVTRRPILAPQWVLRQIEKMGRLDEQDVGRHRLRDDWGGRAFILRPRAVSGESIALTESLRRTGGHAVYGFDGAPVVDNVTGSQLRWRWKPDALMGASAPSRSSRALVRCLSARIARVEDVGDDDLLAEGFRRDLAGGWIDPTTEPAHQPLMFGERASAQAVWLRCWDSFYRGTSSRQHNPLCWVFRFELEA